MDADTAETSYSPAAGQQLDQGSDGAPAVKSDILVHRLHQQQPGSQKVRGNAATPQHATRQLAKPIVSSISSTPSHVTAKREAIAKRAKRNRAVLEGNSSSVVVCTAHILPVDCAGFHGQQHNMTL